MKNIKIYSIILFLFFACFKLSIGQSPIIPPTNTGVVGQGNLPIGWTNYNPSCDVSNSIGLQGLLPYACTVGLPPNQHTSWVSFTTYIDVVEGGGNTESAQTTMSGMIPGQTYTITFYSSCANHANNSFNPYWPNINSYCQGVTMYINNVYTRTFSNNCDGWTTHTHTFTANATSMLLRFEVGGPGGPQGPAGILYTDYPVNISFGPPPPPPCAAGTSAPIKN